MPSLFRSNPHDAWHAIKIFVSLNTVYLINILNDFPSVIAHCTSLFAPTGLKKFVMASTSLVGNRRSLEYEGSNFLRLRLVLSTLSGRPVRIRNIRAKSTMPGLTESEACLIRLFDKITNGSKIEVNETGTSLFYQPGEFHILLRGFWLVYSTVAL